LNFDRKVAKVLLVLLVNLLINRIPGDKSINIGGLELSKSADATNGLRLSLGVLEVIFCEERRDEYSVTSDR
jgi:hypothetical protein